MSNVIAPKHDETGAWTVCKPSGWVVLRTHNGVGAVAYAKALGYYVTRSR